MALRGRKASAEHSDRTSGWMLIAANLVPIGGVIFLGWRIADMLLLYWLELLVYGAFNVLRIAWATPAPDESNHDPDANMVAARIGLSIFFWMFYGMFCLVMVVPVLDAYRADVALRRTPGFDILLDALRRDLWIFVALAGMAASQAWSFYDKYLGRRAWDGLPLAALLARPTVRAAAAACLSFIVAALVRDLRSPVWAVIAFVVIKTIADLVVEAFDHLPPKRTGP